MEGQNSSETEEEKGLIKQGQVGVVMVPLPIQGHLNPLLHLAHLIASYDIPVHFAGPTTQNHQAKLRLHGRDDPHTSSKIHFHDFDLPLLSSSPSPKPTTIVHFPAHLQPLFEAAASHLAQPVGQLIHQVATQLNRVVVIHDHLMASVVKGVKSALPNVETYSFFVISPYHVFCCIWDTLDEKPFRVDPSDIPEFVPISDGCLTEEFLEFRAYQKKVADPDSGRIYNTSRVIDGKYVLLLEKLFSNKPIVKHFAMGPFSPVAQLKDDDQEQRGRRGPFRHVCLKWLDEQEKDSVIYISFGSITTLSDEQIDELATGLEKSGHKFIWVLKSADTARDDNGARGGQLEEGYEERVRDKGMVLREWVPQLEILGHPSVGGFMSHCGWNSTTDSISMGVPIAAWPMHSDQPNVSIFVTQVLRIGVLVRDWARRGELVRASAVENVVRRLMASKEGKEMRARVAKLGDAVRGSFAEGGAARLEMDSFIAHIAR